MASAQFVSLAAKAGHAASDLTLCGAGQPGVVSGCSVAVGEPAGPGGERSSWVWNINPCLDALAEACTGQGVEDTISQGKLSNFIVVDSASCSCFLEIRDLGEIQGSLFACNEWSRGPEGAATAG